MDAERLLSMASARGIDLKHLAGSASITANSSVKTPRTKEEIASGIEAGKTVKGKQTRTAKAPAWSIQDLGLAAAHVPTLPWLAAQYTVAGDEAVYWFLWRRLDEQSSRIASREMWEPRVSSLAGDPKFYRERLVQLVIDSENQDLRHWFIQIPQLYWCYMDVTQQVWDRKLLRKYLAMREIYDRWLNRALAIIRQRINFRDDDAGT